MSPLKPYQGRIIVLLTQQGLLVAEIYLFFSSLFPNLRDFWAALSKEEMYHASWLDYLYRTVQNGTVHFNEERMRTYTVETFIKYLTDTLAKVKQRAPTLREAFSIALDIENSMLMRRIFDHFQTSDRQLATLLRELRLKNAQRRGRIETRASTPSEARSEEAGGR
jgi:rubrerythrin